MTRSGANEAGIDGDRLSLLYEGGIADRGALYLDEYAASLEGWRTLLQLLGELYLYSFPELRTIRGPDLLRTEIIAEREGSYETVVGIIIGAAATGIIGNRADAIAIWSFRKLVAWYRDAVSGYVRKKAETTDITALAGALRQMTEDRGIPIEQDLIADEPKALFTMDEDLVENPPEVAPQANRAQALAEKIDHSLKQATRPLDQSCDRVKVLLPDGSPVLEVGPAERSIIAAPLTVPPPKRSWVRSRVKFERINKKTGRALIYFEGEVPRLHGAHYARIIDDAVNKPNNLYTEAFNNDAALDVWVRQTHPEPGRLNLQWEITSVDPDEAPLFNLPRG